MRSLLLSLALVLAAATAPTTARAQSLTFAPDGKEPIEVTSENGAELQQDAKRVIFRGNAKAVQGAVSVAADELTADYRNTPKGGQEIYRVFATGHVTMKSENETATGETAVYDFDKAVLVLEGDNVGLTSADGTVTAHQTLQYWSNEKVAVAQGAATAIDKNKHKLFGDKLIAFFRDAPDNAANAKGAKAKQSSALLGGQSRGDINYVQGFGNVRMETDKQIVRGDRGAYNIDSGMATLDGDVKLTEGRNQLSGGFAVVNVKGGTSTLYRSAAQAGKPGLSESTRVRALIAPKTNPAAQ